MKLNLNFKQMYLPLLAVLINMILVFGANSATAQTLVNNSIEDQTKGDETVYTVFIPNCFTPNNDGKNDEFIVASELLKRVSMRIYDKTGEEVFATIDMNLGWNGKHNGRELKQDVYLYRIVATYMNGKEEVLVGQVNLMR